MIQTSTRQFKDRVKRRVLFMLLLMSLVVGIWMRPIPDPQLVVLGELARFDSNICQISFTVSNATGKRIAIDQMDLPWSLKSRCMNLRAAYPDRRPLPGSGYIIDPLYGEMVSVRPGETLSGILDLKEVFKLNSAKPAFSIFWAYFPPEQVESGPSSGVLNCRIK